MILLVVVIIVPHPDNVVKQGGTQDGTDLCVIVVLVMTYSFRELQDG